jgi:hypothetical protein
VRPDHLFLGTHQDNALDSFQKGRRSTVKAYSSHARNCRSKTTCKRGHPLSGTNLYIRRNGTRNCRLCLKLANARFMERKHATQ